MNKCKPAKGTILRYLEFERVDIISFTLALYGPAVIANNHSSKKHRDRFQIIFKI